MAASEETQNDAAIRRLARLAGAVAAVVMVSLPSVYFSLSYRFLSGSLEKEAQFNSHLISQRIAANPLGWRYEHYRLTELFERFAAQEKHLYRILDPENRLIVRFGEDVPFPAMTVREGLFDSGRAAGWLEIRRSLRGVLLRTLLAAVLGALLGGLIFMGFRLGPLRALARAWRDLDRSRLFVEGILDNTTDAIVTLDENLRIIQFNKQAEKMFGHAEAEMIGKSIDVILPRELLPVFGSDAHLTWEKGAPAQEAGNRVESVGRSKDAREFPVEVSFSNYRMDGKRTSTLMIRDIAVLKQLEVERQLYIKRLRDALEQLQKSQAMVVRAEKLSSLGVFTAGAAHEILNPANIIGLYAQRMQWENPEGSSGRKTADVILRGVGRITRICDNLRRFSRNDPDRFEPVSLNKIVEESLEPLGPEMRLSGIQVKLDLAEETHTVMGDKNQLQQVMVNLFKNAMDAMPQGGVLSVASREVSEEGVLWREVRVEDTGEGIPADILPKVFDPFFTTKPENKGTGLGLSVAHGIIEGHGGKIWGESAPGRGTAFLVRLPAKQGEGAK
ncbi:MAG: PAS domain S-box protein [Candidatus Tectomicrobia bacterium]|uniref:histidine kinase n=1 Tax=Tectimicrobiota bacterium TaxID=2528274 RepID=A0A932ZTG4_UNCTE|nr:PAS domain S-box protein [Candidatus Tectomicrobia bacterium]